jgi:hypothetical protein
VRLELRLNPSLDVLLPYLSPCLVHPRFTVLKPLRQVDAISPRGRARFPGDSSISLRFR